ncbi:MAG: HAMP domain-containing protein [Gemmatimonadetes bacterium]|jgi:methyl-accepting chemotaxis protein|nr:HAMP domain-containing protein [Gemmatimonadota bacterium]MBT7859446.1 HAMP domain-containing protein [Gemmatimonadota bacterium]
MLKNTKIGTRLALGFGLMLLFILALGIFAVDRMDGLSLLTHKLYRHPFAVSNAVVRVQLNIVKIHRTMKDVASVRDLDQIGGLRDRIVGYEEDVYRDFALIEERFLGDEAMYRTPLQAFKDWKLIRDEVISLIQDGDQQAAYAITIGKGAGHVEMMLAQIQALDEFAQNKAAQFMAGAEETAAHTYEVTVVILASVFVACLVISIFIARSITTPLAEVSLIADQINIGNLGHEVSYRSKDEIGVLSDSFRELIEYVRGMTAAADRLAQGDLTVEVEPRSKSDVLAHSFQGIFGYTREIAQAANSLAQGDLTVEVVPRSDADVLAFSFREMATKLREVFVHLNAQAETLTQASHDLSTVAEQVAGNMSGVSANMVSVSTSADRSTASINTVAASTEEMSSTVSEIARSAEHARQVTGSAVQTVESAVHSVGELGEAAQAIGKVLEVIVEIADQTKLLALNATIEAASAGDAGKGFAVVAGEVKDLARQTSEATEEIRQSIRSIQESTQSTVGEMGQIQGVIREVNEGVSSIAAAVEQQSVTTREMVRNTGQAASASTSIAAEISSVTGASSQVSQAVDQVSNQAQSLARMGAELKQIVEQFRIS